MLSNRDLYAEIEAIEKRMESLDEDSEKDLLKIATYCYICWLKAGHHLKEEHDEDTGK